MSGTTASVIPLASYRNDTPYPFCPGCGHGPILDRLNEALVRLQIEPTRVVLVSDIGCSGLSDQYFVTSAFHGLHGRSLTYATGLKLARPDLEVIVLLGDGGTGIGGAHLLSAARRNVGITLLLFNNFNFGMTGGQHSTTTPPGAVTSTTPGGNLERPLDVCATVAVNGAAYVYRGTSFDDDLTDRIVEAIETPGFALLDIWELCTAYYVPRNKASRKTLATTLEELELEGGLLARREVAEYASAYRAASEPHRGEAPLAAQPLPQLFESSLDRRRSVVLAGSAGARVRSAARLVAEAGVLSGLWVAQRDDYPVTVKSGHSLAQLVLDPERPSALATSGPDALLLLSSDGQRKAAGVLSSMDASSDVFVLPGLGKLDTAARVHVLDPETGPRVAKPLHTLVATAAMSSRLGWVPDAALEEAAARSPHADASLEAVAAGIELAKQG
jgi:pyruvate/2-oxoacid:ferredoxin oxidoreductase beta subunit/Pyruvate/2-oxoacid:ferredoxin oxidoreductase gamma subunit